MGNDYSLALSIFDFLPNIAFLAGMFYLNRWVRIQGTRQNGLFMLSGSMLVFWGGFLKAVWKLLFTLELGNIVWMSESQFILLAPGFFLMLISALGMVSQTQRKVLAAMAVWKIPFLAIMTLSSLGLHAALIFIASRKRLWLTAVLFLISIFCMLSMAGMASMEQTVLQQWIEQGVNSLGQIAFATGSYFLYTRSKMKSLKHEII